MHYVHKFKRTLKKRSLNQTFMKKVRMESQDFLVKPKTVYMVYIVFPWVGLPMDSN